MRVFPRATVATDDIASPGPVLAELREIAHVANAGLDEDNCSDALIPIEKFETDTFNAITRVRAKDSTTTTVAAGDSPRQWMDVPDLGGDITTEDGFLEIEGLAKYSCEWNDPTHAHSFAFGIFVDGGLVALSAPTGRSGILADNVGRSSGYVIGIWPVAAGSHRVKIRWMHLADTKTASDMDVEWLARQMWVREIRR